MEEARQQSFTILPYSISLSYSRYYDPQLILFIISGIYEIKNVSLPLLMRTFICYRFIMSEIKVIVCDYGHCHPIRESVINHAVEHQFGVVYPHQIGSGQLLHWAVIYGDITQNVKLTRCPITKSPWTHQCTFDKDQYPESSHQLIPLYRMSFEGFSTLELQEITEIPDEPDTIAPKPANSAT